jgi:hypothetical protein
MNICDEMRGHCPLLGRCPKSISQKVKSSPHIRSCAKSIPEIHAETNPTITSHKSLWLDLRWPSSGEIEILCLLKVESKPIAFETTYAKTNRVFLWQQ